jgi:Flp pilus assembly protein TadD
MRHNHLAVVVTVASLGLSACASHSTPQAQFSGEPRLRVAQAAEESGDYLLAESIYAGASSGAPTDAAVQLRYADALVRVGKISEARDVLFRHLKTVTDPKQLHGGLGAIYVLLGEPAQAIPEFDAAIATSSDMRWTVNKAVALDLLGRHAEAQESYRRALAAEPDDTVVINDLALSLLLSGRKSEAAEIAAPLVQRADLSPRIRSGLGVLLAAKGDIAGAHEAIGSAMGNEQLLRLAKAIDSIPTAN